jgi:hypothetical protein
MTVKLFNGRAEPRHFFVCESPVYVLRAASLIFSLQAHSL